MCVGGRGRLGIEFEGMIPEAMEIAQVIASRTDRGGGRKGEKGFHPMGREDEKLNQIKKSRSRARETLEEKPSKHTA